MPVSTHLMFGVIIRLLITTEICIDIALSHKVEKYKKMEIRQPRRIYILKQKSD